MDNLPAETASALDLMPIPVFCVRDTKVTYCNPACRHQLFLEVGEDPTPLLGENAALLNREDTSAQCHFTAALPMGEREITLLNLNGNDLFIVSAEQPAVDGVLTSMARAIQNPLTNLLCVADELFPVLEDIEDEEIQRGMAGLMRQVCRLQRTSTEIEMFTYLRSSDHALFLEKTDLLEFFTDLCSHVSDVLSSAGKRLTLTLPDRRVHALIDRQMVRQAVINLAANAATYTSDGEVSLTVQYTARAVIIRVTNRGEGVEDRVLSGAFAHYAAQPQLGDSRWGAGLGLALVQRIAQLHGGTAMLESKAEDGVRASLSLSLFLKPYEAVKTPLIDFTGGADPYVAGFSDLLPRSSFDTRSY